MTLERSDFVRVAGNGFGDPQNSYAFSMAWLDGALYVGTVRNILGLIAAAPPERATRLAQWPVRVPEALYEADQRGQIWRFRPATARQGRTVAPWTCVHRSPVVSRGGGEAVPRDLGYRSMVAFAPNGRESRAVFSASTASSSRGVGTHVLRLGREGVEASPPVLADRELTTLRAMIAHEGRLYMAPSGKGRAWNAADRPRVYESGDPIAGRWIPVSEPHFGDPANVAIYSMAVFRDRIYAGTLNPHRGFQLWRTTGRRGRGLDWVKVIDDGAGRGPLNEGIVSMCEFNDALYLGSGISNGGYDRTYDVGPAAAEIVRVYPDDSWDLVIGRSRHSRGRLVRPLSGLEPGFSNPFAGYIWQLAAHRGSLYAGTFDARVFRLWRAENHPVLDAMPALEEVDPRSEAGAELWRSGDGVEWHPVTRDGFGNPFNYGIRSLLSTPAGLFVGTANPFGPEIAAPNGHGWRYLENPHGGAEVWLGGGVG